MPQQSAPASDELSLMDVSKPPQSACKVQQQGSALIKDSCLFHIPIWELIFNSKSQNRGQKGDIQIQLTEKSLEGS